MFSGERVRLLLRTYRTELLSGGGVIAGSAVLGAALGLLWWFWAPRLELIASPHGALLVDEEPEEFISSDGRFALIVAVAGLVVGFTMWFWRSKRGPVLLVSLALGGLASSVVMWQLGEEAARVNGRDLISKVELGSSVSVPIVQLHATGLLFLQALLAVVTYVVCASWSREPELRPGLSVEPATPRLEPKLDKAQPGAMQLQLKNVVKAE